MVNANDSKFTQITLSLPKCSYKQRNINVYSWSCHRIFVPEQFVNTYVILYYLVFWDVLVSIFLLCSIFLPYLYKRIGIIPVCVIPFFLSGKSIYHIGFLKIAFMKLIANYSKLSQMNANDLAISEYLMNIHSIVTEILCLNIL